TGRSASCPAMWSPSPVIGVGEGGWQMEREAPSPGDRRMARLPYDGECAGSGPSGWSVTWQGYNQGKVSTKN
ncbi:MAG: hypothetical protein OXC57_09215, partial [Rhodobacteraceae bacterium]|nr:hypothetical protein [Paracoccaceae bacterium]